MTRCLDRVAPVVDETIAALAGAKFVEDPIAGPEFSRATSIISSAYKRHGRILEAALVEGLRDSNRHEVWQEDVFRVSAAADHLVQHEADAAHKIAALPYGERRRTLQIDMMVWDYAEQSLRAYEIKRGNGKFDAGKTRSIKRDLICCQLLLRSYGETFGFSAKETDARIIFYYGVVSLPAPYSLTGHELDEHFGFPIRERVEEVNDYFRLRLHDLLAMSD